MTKCLHSVGVWLGALVLFGCNTASPTPVSVLYQVGPTGNFRSIQPALDLAPPGEVIEVQPGTYSEHVVITKAVKLRAAAGAVLDGGSAGTGIGILVSGTSGVELSGFTVQNFERGIVFQNTSNSVLKGNEVRNSNSRTGPPFTIGVTPFEGIVLIASRNNDIAENYSHDNGHDGIMVTNGSSGNMIHNNRFVNNGAQTPTSVG